MRPGLLSKQIKQAHTGPRIIADWVLTLLVFFIILESIQKQRSDTVIVLHLHAINCFDTLKVRVPLDVIVWGKEIPSEDQNNPSETRLSQVCDGIIWVWVWNYIVQQQFIIMNTIYLPTVIFKVVDLNEFYQFFHEEILFLHQKNKLTNELFRCRNGCKQNLAPKLEFQVSGFMK